MNRSRNGTLKKVCSYYNCTNSTVSNADLTFFIFPKDPERRIKWVRNAGLSEKDAEDKNLHLCEAHFKNIYMCHSQRRKLLLQTAVPYRFDEMQKLKQDSESMESLELPQPVAYKEEHIVELDTMVLSEMDNVEETTMIHEGMIDQESFSAEPMDNENTETTSENSAIFDRKRKDPVRQIAKMKAKLHSIKRKTGTPTTVKPHEFTLQLNDGTLIRKVNITSNQLKSLNQEQTGYRLATATVAPQEPTTESSTKSPATSSTNAVEIIEQTEESLSNSSDDEPENVQINEFIFKGEEYVQMPKLFYRKQLEELRRKVARYEHVLQVMRDALDHANSGEN
ncbi:uncharacterized protein LOC131210500 [Anopheles bellator]|uniref:uncharacterized protein LOC131210500 n=1 Tax=Anopheles bellator TaxID=139047 RepID=UPI002649C3F9|nr:uncharacterized protein LOC131210500 [Anopheles bellator]